MKTFQNTEILRSREYYINYLKYFLENNIGQFRYWLKYIWSNLTILIYRSCQKSASCHLVLQDHFGIQSSPFQGLFQTEEFYCKELSADPSNLSKPTWSFWFFSFITLETIDNQASGRIIGVTLRALFFARKSHWKLLNKYNTSNQIGCLWIDLAIQWTSVHLYTSFELNWSNDFNQLFQTNDLFT